MTVSVERVSVGPTAVAGATEFPFSFRFNRQEDIYVEYRPGGGMSARAFSYAGDASSATPAAGQFTIRSADVGGTVIILALAKGELYIERRTPRDQPSSFSGSSRVDPSVLEGALDRIAFQVQELDSHEHGNVATAPAAAATESVAGVVEGATQVEAEASAPADAILGWSTRRLVQWLAGRVPAVFRTGDTSAIPPAKLGSGTADAGAVLHGDGLWKPVSGAPTIKPVLTGFVAISANKGATAAERGTMFAVTTGAANRALALPTAARVNGMTFGAFKLDDSAGRVVISDGTKEIYRLVSIGESAIFMWDGSSWRVVASSGNPSLAAYESLPDASQHRVDEAIILVSQDGSNIPGVYVNRDFTGKNYYEGLVQHSTYSSISLSVEHFTNNPGSSVGLIQWIQGTVGTLESISVEASRAFMPVAARNVYIQALAYRADGGEIRARDAVAGTATRLLMARYQGGDTSAWWSWGNEYRPLDAATTWDDFNVGGRLRFGVYTDGGYANHLVPTPTRHWARITSRPLSITADGSPGLPAYPARGSRNGKVLKFSGNNLTWGDDET